MLGGGGDLTGERWRGQEHDMSTDMAAEQAARQTLGQGLQPAAQSPSSSSFMLGGSPSLSALELSSLPLGTGPEDHDGASRTRGAPTLGVLGEEEAAAGHGHGHDHSHAGG